MRRNGTHVKSKYLLVLLTIVCVSLIALTLSSAVPVAPIRNAAGKLIVPLQSGLNRAGNWIIGRQANQKTDAELTAENEELREKVANLQEQNTILTENQIELEKLRDLYELDREYSQYEKVAANVISKDAGNWYSQFMINKGEDDGVHTDMNVISDGGLVGIVTKTGSNWAQVRSLIDDASNVSAMVLLSSENCIVSGSAGSMDNGRLTLSDLDIAADVSIGEKVVTSNISDKYLPGILIGYIDAVEDDQNHLMQTGELLPVADFSHLDHVLVILETKKAGGDS